MAQVRIAHLLVDPHSLPSPVATARPPSRRAFRLLGTPNASECFPAARELTGKAAEPLHDQVRDGRVVAERRADPGTRAEPELVVEEPGGQQVRGDRDRAAGQVGQERYRFI